MKLSQLLDSNIEKFDEYSFLFYGNKQFTNVETRRYANRLANGFRNRGIQPGDRILVIMPNMPEVLIAYQGITRAGAIIVPVMFSLHPKEIAYIAANCGAKLIITSKIILDHIQQAINLLNIKPTIIITDDDTASTAINIYEYMDSNENLDERFYVDIDSKDTAVILYTSGTTGNPKGVMLTHSNLYSNAVNSAKHANTERGTTLGILPLAHVYGLTISNTCYIVGSSIVIFSRFDPAETLAAIEKHRIKSFASVPAMIHALVSYPDYDRYDLQSLESISSGSAPLPTALLTAFEERFGAKVYEGYGLSEASPIVTAHKKDQPVKPGSVGIPIPGVQIKIVDGLSLELPTGEIGEVVVKGENVTPGYFHNESETNNVLIDGWLHTGDLGHIDEDGYLYIVDRKKDLVIRGGFNIYPRDVEEILSQHHAVSEVAVIGIPDASMGEELVACIVSESKKDIQEEELIAYCQEHLAKNKTPRKILFFESLPRNGVGKILKTHLRTAASEKIVERDYK